MEVSVSGNALKTFARSINCLSKLGNELAIQASTSQLALCTLNSSRSAYQSISFKPGYFDVYNISGTQIQFSILLKAVCAVLRTPLSSIDHLRMHLLDADATKVKWTLDCMNGLKKTYWINCNVEPDIQHLSLEKERFKSSLVIKPRDLNRLLSNFQSSLHEITIIATEPSSVPSEAENEIGGKAVELRSYIDPTNDNGASLHTQLWIDPVEEFLQYVHAGNPVDVTFGVRELKHEAALTLTSAFYAVSGSAAKTGGGGHSKLNQGEMNANSDEQRELRNFSGMRISKAGPSAANVAVDPNSFRYMDIDQPEEYQVFQEKGQGPSQRHLSNWVEADDEDDDDEEEELCVQSTPRYCE